MIQLWLSMLWLLYQFFRNQSPYPVCEIVVFQHDCRIDFPLNCTRVLGLEFNTQILKCPTLDAILCSEAIF